jgi:hypothetical protein
MKKPVYIGRYAMFGNPVVVHGIPGGDCGGTSGWTPGSYLKIEIGMDANWYRVWEGAHHEFFELAILFCHCCYVPFRFLKRQDSQMYHYHLNHEQLTEVVQNASDALFYAIPDIRKVWRKWSKTKN